MWCTDRKEKCRGQVRDTGEKTGIADTEKATKILRQGGENREGEAKLGRDRPSGESGPREKDQTDGRHSAWQVALLTPSCSFSKASFSS